MGIKPTTYKAIATILALLIGATHAHATPAPIEPLVLNARYIVAWSGITLGRINIQANEDATSYRMFIDSKTRGFGALVSDAKQEILAEGKKTADGSYVPAQYVSRPKNKENPDVITLTYDEKGDISKRERGNDDDPRWRAPVPVEEANKSRDPITAAFMLRRALYAAAAEKKLDVNTRTYDGKRLATMRLIRDDQARVEIMGHYIDSISVVIKREPMLGYTPKELKQYKKGDPEIRLYFSDDAAFLPIRATAKVPVGELSMTLVEKF